MEGQVYSAGPGEPSATAIDRLLAMIGLVFRISRPLAWFDFAQDKPASTEPGLLGLGNGLAGEGAERVADAWA